MIKIHRVLWPAIVILLMLAMLAPHLSMTITPAIAGAMSATLGTALILIAPSRFRFIFPLIGGLITLLIAIAQMPAAHQSLLPFVIACLIGTAMALADDQVRTHLPESNTLTGRITVELAAFTVFLFGWAGLLLGLAQSAPVTLETSLTVVAMALMNALAAMQMRCACEADIKCKLPAVHLAQIILALCTGLVLAKVPVLLGRSFDNHITAATIGLMAIPLGAVAAALTLRPVVAVPGLSVWALFVPISALTLLPELPFHILSVFALALLSAHFLLALAQDHLFFAPTHDHPRLEALQKTTGAVLGRVNLESRQVLFSGEGAKRIGGPLRQSFASWLAPCSPTEVLSFFDYLNSGMPNGISTATLSLKGDRGGVQPYRVHLIERRAEVVDFVLTPAGNEKSGELIEIREELARLHLREERLLSLASHELRTPAATLSMLIEDLQSGEPPAEVASQMQRSMGELMEVLSDLRATGAPGADPNGDRLRHSNFEPSNIAQWLERDYGAPAAGAGLEFHQNLPEQANMALAGDVGRMMLALEKLLSFLLQGRGPGHIRLSLMISKESRPNSAKLRQGTLLTREAPVTLVWDLQAQYDHSAPVINDDLFEPFARVPAKSGRASGNRGPGLFTALKAAEAMGGTLSYTGDAHMIRFTLSHPARPTTETAQGVEKNILAL